jgi:hypothetical protein
MRLHAKLFVADVARKARKNTNELTTLRLKEKARSRSAIWFRHTGLRLVFHFAAAKVSSLTYPPERHCSSSRSRLRDLDDQER